MNGAYGLKNPLNFFNKEKIVALFSCSSIFGSASIELYVFKVQHPFELYEIQKFKMVIW